MQNKKVEKINIIALRDEQNRIIGFVSKNGSQTEFYKAELASFDDIEELLKSLIKEKLSTTKSIADSIPE